MKLKDPNDVTSTELAEMCGVTRVTILHYLELGKIPKPAQKRGVKHVWNRAQAQDIKRYFDMCIAEAERRLLGKVFEGDREMTAILAERDKEL